MVERPGAAKRTTLRCCSASKRALYIGNEQASRESATGPTDGRAVFHRTGTTNRARPPLQGSPRARSFANYAGLADEFRRFGNGFTRSSIHRYAQKVKERMALARLEAEIIAALGDDVGWLVKWGRSYPNDAARLVRRLQAKEKQKA